MGERDEEESLPILDAVVRAGDPTLIRSLREGRRTLAELEALRCAVLDVGPIEPAARPGRGDGSPVYLDAETMRPLPVPEGDPGAATDASPERPVDTVRRELRALLGGGAPSHKP